MAHKKEHEPKHGKEHHKGLRHSEHHKGMHGGHKGGKGFVAGPGANLKSMAHK